MNIVKDKHEEFEECCVLPTGEMYEHIEVGEDPKYSDNYVYVKTEIDKLSNTDYSEISRVCDDILTNQSKDLRVAGYLILSKTYTDGIDGLIDASERYLSLINKYGIALHPQRENARLQAYAWLNNEKLIVFFEKFTLNNNVELDKLTQLRNIIDEINNKAIDVFGIKITRWTILNIVLDQKIERLASQNKKQITSVLDKHNEVIEDKAVSSESGLSKYSSEIIEYLHKSEEWLRAIAISRALKWTSLVMPPSDDGCTKLPAPRDVVKSQVTGNGMADDYKRQLATYEQIFLEPGCQYWIDLQYEAQLSARKLNWNNVADLIQELTTRLIKNQPELQRLTFADGTPFAKNKTRQWLKEIVNDQAITHQISDAGENVESLQTKLDKIRRESLSNGIHASLNKVSEIRIRSVCDKFFADLTRLDICLSNDRTDLALHLAESLNKKVTKYKLAMWEPSLAVEVWTRFRDLLIQMQPENEVLKRINSLEEKICEIDIAVAINNL